MGQFDQAKKYIDWILSELLPNGVLSEQINPNTSEPTYDAPLVWSLAELINLMLNYSTLP